MKCPTKLQLSREDGEALRTRLAGDDLSADDRRVLDQVLPGRADGYPSGPPTDPYVRN
jgi:hypothetical protein